GSKVVTFTTGSKNKYRLLWGMNQGGGLSIDDIQVTKVHSYFYDCSNQLQSVNSDSGTKIKFEYDNNGNLVKRLIEK
uniref:RHS repeat domain-containing protein n=1 Tax=Paenibacillus periandrae TaxID=1761741 RepID=UPI001F09D6DE